MTTMPPISQQTRQALRRHQAASPAAPTQPSARDWLDLLRLLAPLGEVWLETRLPGVGLSQRISLHGPRPAGQGASIAARDYALSLFFDDWCRVREIRPTTALDPHRLAIQDRGGATVATLWSEAPICPLLLRSAVRTFQDGGSASSETPRSPDAETSATAQLRGRTHQTRRRLAKTPGLRPLGPERLSGWLDSVLQQALPMRLQMGTAGVVQRGDLLLRPVRQGPSGWLELAGQRARVRLDRARIASAWIHHLPGGHGQRRQVRLYDAQGRALLFVEGVPRSDGAEDPRWRTLLNTLLD